MKKLVIFDLDGTILNTLEDIAASVNYALVKNGLPDRTLSEIRSFVGNGMHNLILRSVPFGTDSNVIQKVETDFSTWYPMHSQERTAAYPGIRELMAELKNRKIKIAVNTNKPDTATQPLLKALFVDLIDFAVGHKPDLPHKPDPFGVKVILEHFNISKEDAVYIGDSEVDIQTAQNAQIESISVAWGFKDRDFLAGFNPSCIVYSPDEILKKICYN